MVPDENQHTCVNCAPLSQILASEFDLEIGLRQRIRQTLKERIAWATLLKESLQTDSQQPTAASESFRYSAFDALRTSEKSTEILLHREEPAPPNLRLQEAIRNARPAPKASARPPRDSKTTFLYIRSSILSGGGRGEDLQSEFKILRCPVCSRANFTSLQGLLNHARISHSLEWGTHEECIRVCAVTDPDINLDAGIEVGGHSGGILPGLRTIFEMAVGPSRPDSGIYPGTTTEPEPKYHPSASTHLTETLGLHVDTPALAFFLGKAPIRRGIKAYQQDEIVDVDGFADNRNLPLKDHWRLRFAQRGDVHRTEAVDTEEPASQVVLDPGIHASRSNSMESDVVEDYQKISSHGTLGSMTRFHFTTRIVVTDRSLWIEPGEETRFTHKWMLTLDAPSYACDITTVLRSMTVTPLSPPNTVRCHQTMVNEPPYAVVGIASQPFLARIELLFNGIDSEDLSSEGQPFSMEHWVDLDPLRCSAAVTGEEQICDIELDKRTIIRPRVSGQQTINFKALWALAADGNPSEHREVDSKSTNQLSYAYEDILRDLLTQFPLTLQGLRRRRGIKAVSYKLVASEAQFLSLIDGRRKAIEWGRARALRDAYNEIAQEKGRPETLPLTTADVQAWLREEGHLHSGSQNRTTADSAKSEGIVSEEADAQWCSLCGLDRALHAFMPKKKLRGEETKMREESKDDTNCPIAAQDSTILRLPPIDVERLKAAEALYQVPIWKPEINPVFSDYRHLLQVVDPGLTLATRQLVRPLRLSSFGSASYSDSPFLLDHLGQTPAEIEAELAPYSMLALLLRPFIQRIVLPGLSIAKRQRGFVSHEIPKKGGSVNERDTSLLTPAHILTGIRNCGRESKPGSNGVEEMILLCLSSLGKTLSTSRPVDIQVKPVVVKTEQL